MSKKISSKIKREHTLASSIRIFANEDDNVVFQLLDENQELMAELFFAKEMSDVALAYMMYAQGAAFGMHPKSGWIH